VKAYLPALLLMTAAAPANAGEIFGGLYLHDVDTPLSKSGIESGVDVHLGYRWDPIGGERGVQPYAFAAVNSAGNTHYAAAGVSYKFGDQVYFRPGLGLAVHTGSAKDFQDPTNDKIDFGSRILFAPEVALGARLNDRMSLEASWVHLSHAQVFGRQNPGMDVIGARLNWKM
jgi:lipid A 3-O-deacylase